MALEFRESTLADSTKEVEEVVAEVVETPVENEVVNEVVETPVEQVETPIEEVAANEGSFITGEEVTEVVAPTVTDWRETLKSVNKKELFEELGLPELDETDIEFAKYRKAGGDPYKYIEQRLMDYNKVSDDVAAKELLKAEYPTLDALKLEKLFANKYSQSEYATDEERELGAIQMEADANKWKQAKVNEQKNFTLPQAIQSQLPPEVQSQIETVRAMNEQAQQIRSFVNEHEVTKGLFQSKRVTVDLGDGKTFNYTIDNPRVITDVLLNEESAAKYGKNAKGEPDMQQAVELALFKINPTKFKQDLFNYGKSVGQQSLIAEKQNAVRPIGKAPAEQQKGMVIKGSGTIGGR